MRQQYESQQDLHNEQTVSGVLQQAWKIAVHKLPISYKVDFVAMREGKAKAVIEIKSRKAKHDQYPTLLLSLSKWNHGIDYVKCNGLDFLIVAQYEDGIYYHKYSDDDEFDIRWGGRTSKTRGSADVEPVIHIPTSVMRKVA
jgi:hypothetical protein